MKPLKVKTYLADTPTAEPKYFKNVALKSGQNVKVADPVASRAMVALMDMQAVLGGAASHFGGPAAFAELISAVQGLVFEKSKNAKKQWHELFHVINDAGHCENGIYAVKANYGYAGLNVQSLKGFRSAESPLSGHGEAHLFPEGVYLSNGPLGSATAQAQGLAQADHLSGQMDRVTILTISDGAAMEGEAKEAFAAIPGFALRGELAPFVMVISDNNTKLSGRIDEQSYSMTPTIEAMAQLGWKVLNLEAGNDLQSCVTSVDQAIEEALENPKQPILIHAKTVKGYGVKQTQESASGGHGFPLKNTAALTEFIAEIYGSKDIPAEFLTWIDELKEIDLKQSQKNKSSQPTEKVQVGVAQALIAAKENGFPVVSITSDLPGSTGVAAFRKKFPESSIDVGIAESNMVSVASGFSKKGFIPVIDTFAQFGVTKGALPLIMASLSQAPVIAIFSHAGFQDAADGASHQSLSYISMTASIPYLDSYCLSCSAEAEALITQAIEEFKHCIESGKAPRSKVFFLGRESFPKTFNESVSYQLGTAQVLADNTENFDQAVTLLTAGPLVAQALKAHEDLAAKSIASVVVNASSLNQPDTATLEKCLVKTKGKMVTVEDHQVKGGLGALYSHEILKAGGTLTRLKSLGVQEQFGQSAYTALELYRKHGLDSGSIVRAAESIL